MVVGVVVCELHIPGARSLKEKRKVVKSLVERAHQRCRVSVAETAFHDLHQRAEIGLAAVGRRESEVEQLIDQLRTLFESQTEAFVTQWDLNTFELGESP
jgi:uncharacterized protein YlxP (DUF503 family)